MTIGEKVIEIKRIISLVCDVVPSLVEIVKEIILLLKGA